VYQEIIKEKCSNIDKRHKKNVNMNLQMSCIHAGLSLIAWLAPLSHKMCCEDT